MIDTHCHLTSADFETDCEAVIQRATAAGFDRFVTIGTEPEDWRKCVALAERVPAVRTAIGIHPNEAGCFSAETMGVLASMGGSPRVVGIGETGLDFYRDTAPREKQFESFRAHLELAEALKKPFILHCRAAENEMLEVLEGHRAKTGRALHGVWHCFTATKEYGTRAAEMGLYFGVGGVMTYPKANEVREAIALLPEDRLVLETDCPYLPPQPWRGKRNEPAFLAAVVQKIADVRNVRLEAVRAFTTGNAERLFGGNIAEPLVRWAQC